MNLLAKIGGLLYRSCKRPFDFFYCKLSPSEFARSLGVKVGRDVRFIGLKPNGSQFGGEPYLIEIGDHVTITAEVQFVNHDGGMWIFRDKEPELNIFGRIKIGNNVFVGLRSVIFPGVTVGNNVVIGACSLVNRDIPDNVVVAGVPAKIICTVDEYYKKNESRMIREPFKDSKDKKDYLLKQEL